MKETTFSINQTAKFVKFKGRKLFFQWLKDKGYLLSNNDAAQKYIDMGWLVLTTKTIYKANPPIVVPVSRVTIKGLAALQKAVLKDFPPCPPCVGVV